MELEINMAETLSDPATKPNGPAVAGNSAIAYNVLKEYGMVPDNVTIVQGGAIKTVWKVSSGGRDYCLKKLRHTLDKAVFSVNAQVHVKNSGGLVPEVFPNRHGEVITQYNGQLFVLYEWIDGKDLDFNVPADLRLAVRGLARFHLASKGYQAPEGARISSKLGIWPDQYTSMAKKLASWKEQAEHGGPGQVLSAYLKHVDGLLSLADKALAALNASDYARRT